MKATKSLLWIASSGVVLPLFDPGAALQAVDPQASTASAIVPDIRVPGRNFEKSQKEYLEQSKSKKLLTVEEIQQILTNKKILDLEPSLNALLTALTEISPQRLALTPQEKNYLEHYLFSYLNLEYTSLTQGAPLDKLWEHVFALFAGRDKHGQERPGLRPEIHKLINEVFEPPTREGQGSFVARVPYQDKWTRAWLEAMSYAPASPPLSARVKESLQKIGSDSPLWPEVVRFLLPRYRLPSYDPTLAPPSTSLTDLAQKVENLSLLPSWGPQLRAQQQKFLLDNSVYLQYILDKKTRKLSGPAIDTIVSQQKELLSKNSLEIPPTRSSNASSEIPVPRHAPEPPRVTQKGLRKSLGISSALTVAEQGKPELYLPAKMKELQGKISALASSFAQHPEMDAEYNKLLLQHQLLEDLQRGISLLDATLPEIFSTPTQLGVVERSRFQESVTTILATGLSSLESHPRSLPETITQLGNISHTFWSRVYTLLSDPRQGVLRPLSCNETRRYFEAPHNDLAPFTPIATEAARFGQFLQKNYDEVVAPRSFLADRNRQMRIQHKGLRQALMTMTQQAYQGGNPSVAAAYLRLLLSAAPEPNAAASVAGSLQKELDLLQILPGSDFLFTSSLNATLVQELPKLLAEIQQQQSDGPGLRAVLHAAQNLRTQLYGGTQPRDGWQMARPTQEGSLGGSSTESGPKRTWEEMEGQGGREEQLSRPEESGERPQEQRESVIRFAGSEAGRPSVIQHTNSNGHPVGRK